MMIAYFDESGTHRSSKAIIYAGFVASDQRWQIFGSEWARCLAEANVPYFHATDLEALRGAYSGWTVQKRIAFQSTLGDLIRGTVECGIAVGLSPHSYSTHVSKETAFQKLFMSPSTHCGISCVLRVLAWMKAKGEQGPIRCVFESGGPSHGELTEYYKLLRAREPLLEGITFEDKRTTYGLQAADFHAYEAWKEVENRVVSGVQRPERKSLRAIVNQETEGWFLTPDALEAHVKDMRERWEALGIPKDELA
jgi:hypothetical protein